MNVFFIFEENGPTQSKQLGTVHLRYFYPFVLYFCTTFFKIVKNDIKFVINLCIILAHPIKNSKSALACK